MTLTGPAASNLQPSDLHSNAYRSLPGGQDFSSCYFQISISIETFVSNSLPLSTTDGAKWASFKYD